MAQPHKYRLYELAVQSPEVHAAWFDRMFQDVRAFPATSFCEDFCGTFALSCAWIQMRPVNRALGIDLDPEPLAYGQRVHAKALTVQQRKRLDIRQADVLKRDLPKSDIVCACNFSFCIFKDRALLIRYMSAVRKRLTRNGIFIMEAAGGPGMIESLKERKTLELRDGSKCRYIWDQKSFDPITHDALYAIHFRLPDGSMMQDAFTYDWRLWTIPELRDCLLETGFRQVTVYWERQEKGKGTGEYVPMTAGDNAHAWVAYIVAF